MEIAFGMGSTAGTEATSWGGVAAWMTGSTCGLGGRGGSGGGAWGKGSGGVMRLTTNGASFFPISGLACMTR